VKIGHDQLRNAMVDVCMKAYGNCTRGPVVRAVSQRAKEDGGSGGLIVDFSTRDVWEGSRDCLFDTRRIIHAGSPGCASLSRHLLQQCPQQPGATEDRQVQSGRGGVAGYLLTPHHHC